MIDARSDPAIGAADLPGGLVCLYRGAALCRRAPAVLFVLALAAQYAALVPDILQAVAPRWAAHGIVLMLAAAWLQAVFYGALIVCLDRAAGGSSRRPGPGATVNLAIAGIVYVAATGAGLVLFILPGVFISIAWLFFAFPIVLEGAGSIAGLAASQRRVMPRFWRVSATISVTFVLYSLYAVTTWAPDFLGVAWQPLARLVFEARRGMAAPMELVIQAQTLIGSGSVAAPWWYFVLNPLLGAVVMPVVVGAVYWVYRGLGVDE